MPEYVINHIKYSEGLLVAGNTFWSRRRMSTPMMSPPFSHNRLLKTSIISIMRQRRRYGAAHKGGDTGGVVGGAVAETENQQHQDRS